MINYTFKYYIEFGKCDWTDGEFDYKISEDEYDTIKNIIDNELDFETAAPDLYDKVFSAAYNQECETILETNTMTADDFNSEEEYQEYISDPLSYYIFKIQLY